MSRAGGRFRKVLEKKTFSNPTDKSIKKLVNISNNRGSTISGEYLRKLSGDDKLRYMNMDFLENVLRFITQFPKEEDLTLENIIPYITNYQELKKGEIITSFKRYYDHITTLS